MVNDLVSINPLHPLPLDLLLEGLPLTSELRDTCQSLFDALLSEQPAVAEQACLDLHRLAGESLAISMALYRAAALAEAKLKTPH